MSPGEFKNPYRPGAGHMPPYLAGRQREYAEFDRLLAQEEIFENLVLTGLRGVGKTVLLETFKPRAMSRGWLWATADLSESASISERPEPFQKPMGRARCEASIAAASVVSLPCRLSVNSTVMMSAVKGLPSPTSLI